MFHAWLRKTALGIIKKQTNLEQISPSLCLESSLNGQIPSPSLLCGNIHPSYRPEGTSIPCHGHLQPALLSMDEEMAGYQSGIFSLEDSIDSSINTNVARALGKTKLQGWAFLLSVRLISFTNTECFLYTSNGKWWECSIKKVEQLCHQIAQWSESVSLMIVLSYQSTACLTLTWPLYKYTTNKGLLSRGLRCQEVPAADCICLDCLNFLFECLSACYKGH